jgi:hypothetical protein
MALVATESTDLPFLEVMNLLIMLSTWLLSHVHDCSQPKYPEGSSQQKLDQQHEAAHDVEEEEVEVIVVG